MTVLQLDEHGRAAPGDELGDLVDRGVAGHDGKRLAHHFPHQHLAEVASLQGELEDIIFIDGPYRGAVFEHGELGDVLGLHRVQGMVNGLIGEHVQQVAGAAADRLEAHQIVGGKGNLGFEVTVVAHPLVVVNLAQVAHSRVRQESHHKAFLQALGHLQSRIHAAPARAPGEDALQPGQAAGPEEAVTVGDLDNVVEDGEIHGDGKDVLADPFYYIRRCFADLPRLEILVIEGAHRVDPNDLDLGILFLQVPRHPGNRAPGPQPDDEVGDFAPAVFPDLRPGSAVMRLRVHGVLVLVRVHGVGDLPGQAAGHGVVAPGIVRGDRRGADDHFRPQRLEQVDLLL